MAEQEFKVGDVVYHKANGLRMVVIEVRGTEVKCRYINAEGAFDKFTFLIEELTSNDTSNINDTVQLGRKQ